MPSDRVPIMLDEAELAHILHAIGQAPGAERPNGGTIRKLLSTYHRAGGDPAEFAELREQS